MFYTQNMVLSSIFHNLSRCGHSGILAYLSSKEFISSIYFIICITILRDKFVSKGLAKGRNTEELRSWFPLSAAFPDGPDPHSTSFHSFLEGDRTSALSLSTRPFTPSPSSTPRSTEG